MIMNSMPSANLRRLQQRARQRDTPVEPVAPVLPALMQHYQLLKTMLTMKPNAICQMTATVGISDSQSLSDK